MTRSRRRRALYEIAERDDHHLLKDIGVSREETFREAGKRFWRQQVSAQVLRHSRCNECAL